MPLPVTAGREREAAVRRVRQIDRHVPQVEHVRIGADTSTPKNVLVRVAKQPIAMCIIRHAIVVTRGGSDSGSMPAR